MEELAQTSVLIGLVWSEDEHNEIVMDNNELLVPIYSDRKSDRIARNGRILPDSTDN